MPHVVTTSSFEDNALQLTVVRADETDRADLKIEIGHVLCLDVVGYSKLLIHEQNELLRQLNEIVRTTPQFRASAAAGTLLRLPAGDGMVLVFGESPEAPLRCAVEISEAVKTIPALRLRMGIHSGPVSEVHDVAERTNLAGAGVNIAQRVMDCGDAGHILLSRHIAEDLEHYSRWQPHLHELGKFEVKHGALLSVINFFNDEVGNSSRPEKLAQRSAKERPSHQRKAALTWIVIAGLALLIAAILILRRPDAGSASALKAPSSAGPATAIPEKSIAVLPFENLSEDKETAFFADGIQDEILTNLAKIADLKVISRTSVMQYRTIRARNLREIGRQLGVARILEGSVQRAGDRVRVNAQLIDARTDAHLWAQVYDRSLADIFAIQTEIARTIADQLQANLSPRERRALGEASTTNLVAEELLGQAWAQVELASNPDAKANLLQAISLLDEAITRDPKFLRAYALLCTANLDLYWQGFDHTPQRLELARQVIERAAAIRPDDGLVHSMRADYAYKAFRDYDRALAELKLAGKTLPNAPLNYIYAGAIERRQGHWNESVRNWEKGVSLDPRNYRYVLETAFTYQVMRRYEDAGRMYRRALSFKPDDHLARVQLAHLKFLARGELGPWRAELGKILDEDPTAATGIANDLFECALAERDREGLLRALQSIRPEGLRDLYNNSLWARDWFAGLAARSLGDNADAKRAFTTARAIEQKEITDQPDYAAAWSRLGLIDAGLGRKAEAQAEGRRACELLPVSKDAVDGPSYLTNLALIYAWTDDKDKAFEQLEKSAALPGGISYGELKVMPQWSSLRNDPRFDKILATLAPTRAKPQ